MSAEDFRLVLTPSKWGAETFVLTKMELDQMESPMSPDCDSHSDTSLSADDRTAVRSSTASRQQQLFSSNVSAREAVTPW